MYPPPSILLLFPAPPCYSNPPSFAMSNPLLPSFPLQLPRTSSLHTRSPCPKLRAMPITAYGRCCDMTVPVRVAAWKHSEKTAGEAVETWKTRASPQLCLAHAISWCQTVRARVNASPGSVPLSMYAVLYAPRPEAFYKCRENEDNLCLGSYYLKKNASGWHSYCARILLCTLAWAEA